MPLNIWSELKHKWDFAWLGLSGITMVFGCTPLFSWAKVAPQCGEGPWRRCTGMQNHRHHQQLQKWQQSKAAKGDRSRSWELGAGENETEAGRIGNSRWGSLGMWWSGTGHSCSGLVGTVMSTKIKSKMQANGYFPFVFCLCLSRQSSLRPFVARPRHPAHFCV